MNPVENDRLRRAIIRLCEFARDNNTIFSGAEIMDKFYGPGKWHENDQRKMRDLIADMQIEGILIVGFSGQGYRMAKSLDEVERYYDEELQPRIRALSHKGKMMREAAIAQFGAQKQLWLEETNVNV